jgi:methionyl-tRNA formyltransferase
MKPPNVLAFRCSRPKSLKSDEEQAAFKALEADVAVVVAYGLLLPKAVLDAPRLGAWNGHASLLPRWRGAAPIQRAIMAGDTETGVMIMQMDVGLDTGPVALTQTVDISANMTAGELHDVLAGVTAKLMSDAMARLERGELPVRPQPGEGVSYAAKISQGGDACGFHPGCSRRAQSCPRPGTGARRLVRAADRRIAPSG